MTPKSGRNGKVRTIRYKTPDGTEVYIGPWPSARPKPTHDIVDDHASPVPAHAASPAETYDAPSPTPPAPSSPRRAGALEYVPEESHLEQAVAAFESANLVPAEKRRGLSSVATIAKYTALGLAAGAGIGAVSYYLVDDPRSLTSSLVFGAVFTLISIVEGVYQAQKAKHQQRN